MHIGPPESALGHEVVVSSRACSGCRELGEGGPRDISQGWRPGHPVCCGRMGQMGSLAAGTRLLRAVVVF